VYDGIPYQVKQRAGNRAITAENMEKSQHTDFNEDTTSKSASVATYGCESWTLGKNEETRLDAFEMKGLRKILRVSWTAKKTNEWVLNKAGVKRQLLDTVKARKLAYYGYTMRKQGSCLEKEIMQGTMPDTEACQGLHLLPLCDVMRCTQARKATHGLDGQHHDVDRTLRGRINQNDRGQ